MDPSLLWTGALTAGVLLGIHGAYYGALGDACLKIGKGLSASEGTRGFQDALTPPASVAARLINWSASLLFVGGTWYYLGFTGLTAFIAARLASTIVPGAILKSNPPKKHFCRKIYHSMANREANYAKAGDRMRAAAMGDLRAKFERSSFGSRLL